MASDPSRRPSSPDASSRDNDRLSRNFSVHRAGSSATSSCASSLGSGGGDSASTNSDDAASASSLGGLNHVNDGAGGSTAQRRMSRVFTADDLHKPRGLSTDIERRSSNILLITTATLAASSSVTGPASDFPLLVNSDSEERESCWKSWIRKRVPIFGWLVSPGYDLRDLPDDLIAGISKWSMISSYMPT